MTQDSNFLTAPSAQPATPPARTRPAPARPEGAGRAGWLPAWLKSSPFVALHLALVAVFFVPVDATALVLCAVAYVVRMFGITGGYHRYFAHRAYKASRPVQFALAWLGCS